MSDRVHVIPLNDAVDHDTDNSDECVCGPDVEYLDGGGAIVVHHSLDGREHDEPGHDSAACPHCSSRGASA